ncbi:deoxyribose-phosphate aldolase [Amphibacillus xylanus]|uniref:Deoxyribose-phosphate aldolase n=1 Tax=Amphibacillus xylanus (strain ATCC 51415 / DSM 6626 / JCM 7361 / LMG 17667 / NBRC 15112 / Ep01) TaxID=698758 RepID=K0IZJ6_AMPXN|nr:deoxyribose-phosphate aldolase [Amphibacillus xylanus]BAM46392.1 deoxyribose-phosphate aldolase [Amphibacillus xylanus NBRC 15112]
MNYDLARFIDHTTLKADATKNEILLLCQEAIEYGFFSVCVNPTWVKLAYEQLQGTNVKVCTVVGFPLGASTSEVKAFETKDAIANGATEIDMVINIGALKAGNLELVEKDIRVVVDAATNKALVKVIIETSLLTNQEKVTACEIAVRTGADYVKTSTGFSTGGATASDISLMRKVVGPSIGVKASGGVRDKATAIELIEAGASRIGASAGVDIVKA